MTEPHTYKAGDVLSHKNGDWVLSAHGAAIANAAAEAALRSVDEAADRLEGGTLYGEVWVEGWTVRNQDHVPGMMTGDGPVFTEALFVAAGTSNTQEAGSDD